MFNLCLSVAPFLTDKFRSLNHFHSGLFELCEHVLWVAVVINDAPSTERVAYHTMIYRIEHAHFGLQFKSRNYLLFMVPTGNYGYSFLHLNSSLFDPNCLNGSKLHAWTEAVSCWWKRSVDVWNTSNFKQVAVCSTVEMNAAYYS